MKLADALESCVSVFLCNRHGRQKPLKGERDFCPGLNQVGFGRLNCPYAFPLGANMHLRHHVNRRGVTIVVSEDKLVAGEVNVVRALAYSFSTDLVRVLIDEPLQPLKAAALPAPGFYISTTSLEDANFNRKDPRRYADRESIPYIVLPGGKLGGAKLGDLALLINLETRRK